MLDVCSDGELEGRINVMLGRWLLKVLDGRMDRWLARCMII